MKFRIVIDEKIVAIIDAEDLEIAGEFADVFYPKWEEVRAI